MPHREILILGQGKVLSHKRSGPRGKPALGEGSLSLGRGVSGLLPPSPWQGSEPAELWGPGAARGLCRRRALEGGAISPRLPGDSWQVPRSTWGGSRPRRAAAPCSPGPCSGEGGPSRKEGRACPCPDVTHPAVVSSDKSGPCAGGPPAGSLRKGWPAVCPSGLVPRSAVPPGAGQGLLLVPQDVQLLLVLCEQPLEAQVLPDDWKQLLEKFPLSQAHDR